jgi:hypothetical protein
VSDILIGNRHDVPDTEGTVIEGVSHLAIIPDFLSRHVLNASLCGRGVQAVCKKPAPPPHALLELHKWLSKPDLAQGKEWSPTWK